MSNGIFVRVTFKEPTCGYWDGGAKTVGDFGYTRRGKKIVRWGCYDLNHWFDTSAGRSIKQAASFARRHLIHSLRRPATVEVVNG